MFQKYDLQRCLLDTGTFSITRIYGTPRYACGFFQSAKDLYIF
jgi:hypothetical protein